MTWNLSAVESNPCAKDLRNLKRFILFLGDVWQARSAAMLRPRYSICPLIYNLALDTWNWPFGFIYWTSVRCTTEKIHPNRLHNSTESVRMIKLTFKEVTQGSTHMQFIVWKRPRCRRSTVPISPHTYPYVHGFQTVIARLLLNKSFFLPMKWKHIPPTKLLPVGRQRLHVGGPVHVRRCTSAQVRSLSCLTHTELPHYSRCVSSCVQLQRIIES